MCCRRPSGGGSGSQSFYFSSASGAVSLHKTIVKGEAQSIKGIVSAITEDDVIQGIQILSGHLIMDRDHCFLCGSHKLSVHVLILAADTFCMVHGASESLYTVRIRIRS